MVKNPPANAGDIRDAGWIPGSGRFLGGGHGNPLQYSSLVNPMDRGAWQAMVHRVAKSHARLKQLSTDACRYRPELRRAIGPERQSKEMTNLEGEKRKYWVNQEFPGEVLQGKLISDNGLLLVWPPFSHKCLLQM